MVSKEQSASQKQSAVIAKIIYFSIQHKNNKMEILISCWNSTKTEFITLGC